MAEQKQTITEIVMKLIGKVHPQGETNSDNEMYENLKQLIELTGNLVDIIDDVSNNKSRYEYSMKRAGETAEQFMQNIGRSNN